MTELCSDTLDTHHSYFSPLSDVRQERLAKHLYEAWIRHETVVAGLPMDGAGRWKWEELEPDQQRGYRAMAVAALDAIILSALAAADAVTLESERTGQQTTTFTIAPDRLLGEWHPIDTVPEGEPVLLFWPHGECGGWGGIESAIVFKSQYEPTGFIYWSHGSSNGGYDWQPRDDERPTHWMRMPAGPRERDAAA